MTDASANIPEIGAVAPAGDAHAGFIYGGILPSDNKPIWFSQLAPKLMNHFDAAAWAEEQGGSLPTSEEGKYIDTIKDKGALKDIFARHSDGSSSAGYFWLVEHIDFFARSQQFSDGSQPSTTATSPTGTSVCRSCLSGDEVFNQVKLLISQPSTRKTST
jgi:hypothetical protein